MGGWKDPEKEKAWREVNRDRTNARRRHLRATYPDKYRPIGREEARKWREANPDKKKEIDRIASRKYRAKNREKCIAAVRASTLKRQKERPEEFRAMKLRCQRRRMRESLNYRISQRLTSRLRDALCGRLKAGSAVRDLGCSIGEFRLYIENQFDEGMTWDNYGEVWELDHVMPLNQFDLTDRVELLEACNWLNIRPLTVHENRSRPKDGRS